VVGVEKVNDSFVGQFSSPVFENPHISIFGKRRTDSLRESNRAVMLIVVADESADESDHNVGESRGIVGTKRWSLGRA